MLVPIARLVDDLYTTNIPQNAVRDQPFAPEFFAVLTDFILIQFGFERSTVTSSNVSPTDVEIIGVSLSRWSH